MNNPFRYSVKQLEETAHKVRVDLIKALANAGSGHSGGPLGFADVVSAVYFYGAGVDPSNPSHPDRDRVVFSAGHYSPLIYSVLAHAGYFGVEHFIADYRKFGGHLDGHPNTKTPGVETCSGPLGQGTSQAVGMAATGKLDKKSWKVWLLMSDGEQQEGQTQEALMWAGYRKLDNLIGIVDFNNMQISGKVEDVLAEDWLEQNYQNYGWEVKAVDGNNMKEIVRALDWTLRPGQNKPRLIVAKTMPGKGVSFMEGDYTWHGKPPKGEEVTKALEDLYKVGSKLGIDYR